MVNCPLCDAVIDVDEEELDEGDSLICEECGANLNVSGVSPLELVPDGVDEVEAFVLQKVRGGRREHQQRVARVPVGHERHLHPQGGAVPRSGATLHAD